MKVYHVTGEFSAAAIRRGGFRDVADPGGGGASGVWLADAIPGRGDVRGLADVVVSLEVDESTLAPFERTGEGKGFREWVVPAAILAGLPCEFSAHPSHSAAPPDARVPVLPAGALRYPSPRVWALSGELEIVRALLASCSNPLERQLLEAKKAKLETELADARRQDLQRP